MVRSQVTTFNYGGFGQMETVHEITKQSLIPRLRRMVDPSDMYKSDPDPFAIPEVESYTLEDKAQPNYINQQDPKVQDVDVVGWFE